MKHKNTRDEKYKNCLRHTTASKADSTMQKKESMAWKTEHVKLSSQRKKNEKE